jgi:hypothetical protein
VSYLDLAREMLEKMPKSVPEVNKPADLPRPAPRPSAPPKRAPRKPWNPTPADEAVICRAIEKDQGLPAGSVRLYTPQEFRHKFGDKRL